MRRTSFIVRRIALAKVSQKMDYPAYKTIMSD